jgi:hypothetical protein
MNRTCVAGLLVCGLLYWGASQAQTPVAVPRNYVVMSLIGDNLSIVNFEGGDTGSRLNKNRNYDIPIKENTFDATVLNAIAKRVRTIDPDAAQDVLETRNATLFRLQDRIFESTDSAKAIRESLKGLLKDRNATRLILVTKHRADTHIQLAHETVGSGTLEGLGFYVDGRITLINTATLQGGFGLIAPYMYVTFWLVDAKTMEVLRELPATEAITLEKMGSRDAEPTSWDRLDDARRIRLIKFMIERTVNTVMPKLLAPTP